MRSVIEMETETVIQATKAASAIDHLKNNRIEYLLVMILCHFLGVTDKIVSQATGVCF